MKSPGSEIRFDAAGLVPAIAQDRLTGQVRMVAYMSKDALDTAVQRGNQMLRQFERTVSR